MVRSHRFTVQPSDEGGVTIPWIKNVETLKKDA